jgi:hypothetical protein
VQSSRQHYADDETQMDGPRDADDEIPAKVEGRTELDDLTCSTEVIELDPKDDEVIPAEKERLKKCPYIEGN